MCLLFGPEKRSSSEWPGTARPSALVGRWRVETVSMICPNPLFRMPLLGVAHLPCCSQVHHQLLLQHAADLNKETIFGDKAKISQAELGRVPINA
jgi:hypothetical protein